MRGKRPHVFVNRSRQEGAFALQVALTRVREQHELQTCYKRPTLFSRISFFDSPFYLFPFLSSPLESRRVASFPLMVRVEAWFVHAQLSLLYFHADDSLDQRGRATYVRPRHSVPCNCERPSINLVVFRSIFSRTASSEPGGTIFTLSKNTTRQLLIRGKKKSLFVKQQQQKRCDDKNT